MNNTIWDYKFNEIITMGRKAKKLSKTELAERCEVTTMYISLIENDMRIPRPNVCRRLAKALDLDEEHLIFSAHSAQGANLVSHPDQLIIRYKMLAAEIRRLTKTQQEEVINKCQPELKRLLEELQSLFSE